MIQVQCPNCKGNGFISLSACERCGGHPMDPDRSKGTGKLSISREDLILLYDEAKRTGEILATKEGNIL